MKYLITSGCSFTRQEYRCNTEGNCVDFENDFIEMWRWPHWIKKLYHVNVLNYGSATNDNHTIANSIIYGVEKLLKKGILPKDISVIAQWSNFSRQAFFISNEKIDEFGIDLNGLAHISDWIEEKEYNGQYGYWFLTGGYGVGHVDNKIKEFLPYFIKYILSNDNCLIYHFEAILKLQNYLKLKGIEYITFDIQNNFSKSYTKDSGMGFPNYREKDKDKFSEAILDRKFIPNTWDFDNIYDYSDTPYVKNLIDMIDWSNHWFYSEDGITKHGGIIEWAIRNWDISNIKTYPNRPLDINKEVYADILFMEHHNKTLEEIKYEMDNKWYLGHVSSVLNKKFVQEILCEFLSKYELKNKLL